MHVLRSLVSFSIVLTSQEFMSEISMLKTQVTMPQSSADLSLNTTGNYSRRYDSSISSAINRTKAKPKFAEFMCSNYEVRLFALRWWCLTRVWKQVFAFVKSATLLVIPNALWGNKANKAQALKCRSSGWSAFHAVDNALDRRLAHHSPAAVREHNSPRRHARTGVVGLHLDP